jgi:hypothetical protein
VRGDAAGNLARVPHAHFETHLRVALAEGGDRRREDVRAGDRSRADHDLAGEDLPLLPELRFDGVAVVARLPFSLTKLLGVHSLQYNYGK